MNSNEGDHLTSASDDARTVADPDGGIRVLLVDDHAILRAGVKALLDTEQDMRVVAEAEDGLEAISRAHEQPVDVVIMDVSLPNLGGAEATRRLLLGDPSLRVLVLSAHEELAVARMALDSGATGYVLKRSAVGELVRAVRVVAAGGTYIDPSLAGQLVSGASSKLSGGGAAVATLSEREAEVIRLIAQGLTSKEMASALGLSPRTLETYKARAMSKLNLRTRADLIRYALRSGWLSDT